MLQPEVIITLKRGEEEDRERGGDGWIDRRGKGGVEGGGGGGTISSLAFVSSFL